MTLTGREPRNSAKDTSIAASEPVSPANAVVALSSKAARSTVSQVASCLRTLSIAADPDTMIGSEETLVVKLGAARATVRQAARILEREGLLAVRRGLNGGYFAARPDATTIETAVSAYLDTLNIDIEDVSIVAAVLWIEVVRKACNLRTPAAVATAKKLKAKVAKVRLTTSFRQIIEIEHDIRVALFELTKAQYIDLIFQINYVFSRRRFMVEERIGDRPDDAEFVSQWRDFKLLELEAIVTGKPEFGVLAALHARDLWQARFSLPDDLA